jgi:hypothetical protein
VYFLLPNAEVKNHIFRHFFAANSGGFIVTTAINASTKSTEPNVSATTKIARQEVKQRRHAEPIKFILDRDTRDVVGWLYKWNTGALVPMWKDGACQNVIYE